MYTQDIGLSALWHLLCLENFQSGQGGNEVCLLICGPLGRPPSVSDSTPNKTGNESKNILYLQPCWALGPRQGAPPYPADRVSFRLIKGLCLEEQSIRGSQRHRRDVVPASILYTLPSAAVCESRRRVASGAFAGGDKNKIGFGYLWDPLSKSN